MGSIGDILLEVTEEESEDIINNSIDKTVKTNPNTSIRMTKARKEEIKNIIKEMLSAGIDRNTIFHHIRDNKGFSQTFKTFEAILTEVYAELREYYQEQSEQRLAEDMAFMYSKRNTLKDEKLVHDYVKEINKVQQRHVQKHEIDISGDINVIYLDQQDESL